MANVSRRTAIKAIGGAALTTGLTLTGAAAQGRTSTTPVTTPATAAGATPADAAAQPTTYLFFNADEAAFIEAAVARLIPADEKWGGAVEAGVPNFLDKQLGGAWGAGERLYRSGPWHPGQWTQGYQLPFTPAEFFKKALAAINKELAATPFAKMSADQQDAYLHSLETGDKDLDGIPGKLFFATLWQCT